MKYTCAAAVIIAQCDRCGLDAVQPDRHVDDDVKAAAVDFINKVGRLGPFTRIKAQRAFVLSIDWPESSCYGRVTAYQAVLVEHSIDAQICWRGLRKTGSLVLLTLVHACRRPQIDFRQFTLTD